MRQVPVVYDLFNPPEDAGVDCSVGLGADQSFKEECDINVIMERASRGAEIIDPMLVGNKVGEYMDISTAPQDYMEAHNIMVDATNRFDELPARLRSRFSNDPLELLLFLQDEKNRAEGIELGLINKPVEPPAAPAA
jgi:phage internal scaffolding protein